MSKKFLEIKNVDFNIGGKAKVKNASFPAINAYHFVGWGMVYSHRCSRE